MTDRVKTMYDELLHGLRICEEGGGCDRCPKWNDKQNGGLSDCTSALCKEAADAIEELSAINQKQLLEIAVLMTKPRWIPVTERLPEEYKDVLCYYEYFRYGDYNCMFRTIDRGYYGNGRWGGEAGQGHKNKVLAWMPLPEPPKESES